MTSLTEKEVDDYVREQYPDLTPPQRFALFANLAVNEWKKTTGSDIAPILFTAAVAWVLAEIKKAYEKKNPRKRLTDGQ
jgi:hypothetical protein